MKFFTFLARRFVAGETAQDGLAAVRRMNQAGIKGMLDFLGEDVRSPQMAQAAAEEYVRLLALIDEHRLECCLSLKVSQMGMLISRELCLENLRQVLEEAVRRENFVWMDMEGSALTQKTLDIFNRLRDEYQNIGICVQAGLVRTGSDLAELMRQPNRVRLCKGAYREPPQIAFPSKRSVDGNYRMLAQKLLDQALTENAVPAFATHDAKMIDYVVSAAQKRALEPRRLEFQMLYGIRNRTLASLARQGFQASVYIPYGRAWFPYLMRRLKERKENVYFLIRNLFKM